MVVFMTIFIHPYTLKWKHYITASLTWPIKDHLKGQVRNTHYSNDKQQSFSVLLLSFPQSFEELVSCRSPPPPTLLAGKMSASLTAVKPRSSAPSTSYRRLQQDYMLLISSSPSCYQMRITAQCVCARKTAHMNGILMQTPHISALNSSTAASERTEQSSSLRFVPLSRDVGGWFREINQIKW